ncbi:mechanosensitive ion channel family protein [Halosimplex pelagicum]|uniref:Mechanosensitive ion channel family protein n=1 Tax=Halosimplex pelagicum TaxID=869886 RepID=A0A7D5PFX9_9EURY|nr:mechanosensitive ion channel family protein [Halosimplex pelagicum]QLH83239.1 mechanosensitive ion channel family protein [Halosimplex pelagicum]
MLQATPVDAARSFLTGFETLGARLGVTALLLAVVATFGWLVLPRLIQGVQDSALQWAVSGAVLRAAQLSLLVGGGFSLVYLWGYGPALATLADELTNDQELQALGRALGSVAVFFAAYAVARYLSNAVTNLGRHAEWLTDHQEEILLRTAQLFLFGFAGIVILGIWDTNLGGLLVGAGFLGIVVGFAARQTLGSLIAGFVLMFSRPFTIGDWVEIGGEEGIVTDITIFHTRLENFDGEFVIIPNDRVSDRPITNRSQKGLLRIRVDVSIDYETDPDRAKQVAIEAISNCSEVVDAPPPQVFPKEFGDSSVVLEMRFWIDHPTPPRKWKAVSAVVSAVKAAFEEEDIKIPFPQRELTGRAETGGFNVRGRAGPNAEDAQAEARGND